MIARALAVVCVLGLLLTSSRPVVADDKPAQKPLPAVQVFVPGFTVRLLPVTLTNLVSIEYAPDGRLFAAGYDGRLHMLTDTDGDGLEDKVQTFWEKTSADYPLGLVVHEGAVYVLLTAELVRFVDTDGDKLPETREVVLRDWDDPAMHKHPLLNHRRVDYGMGLAIGPDGSIYIGVGNAAYNNGYMLDKEGKLGERNRSHFDRRNPRGCVLKFSPDGKTKEQILTGVRYLMCMRFNREGDLFATDQEGATWLPNGNPFDELLHLQPGRHYGFPPRHPRHLPDVIDEPSVFDYASQHQSLCGMRFNEPTSTGKLFGPERWRGNAFLAGFTRGKIYRTELVKTAEGYVAQNQLFAGLQSLAADLSFSPTGEMVVASHTGNPDWGTGPNGTGLLHKIRYEHAGTPLPVSAWSAGPGVFHVAFDRPLDPAQLKSLAGNVQVTAGRFVSAGDRFETIRPGYEVVKQQVATPRHELAVLSASVSADGRTLRLVTPAQALSRNYAITLPALGRAVPAHGEIGQQGAIDLATSLNGFVADWKSDSGNETWTGWLPHVDLAVAAQLTPSSSEHEQLAQRLKQTGRLTLRGQLDLWQMLQPAIQPGAKLDYERPVEQVSVVIASTKPFQVKRGKDSLDSLGGSDAHRVTWQAPGREKEWLPLEIMLPTGSAGVDLRISWFTDQDSRPRAFPLRRFLLPWARPDTGAELPTPDRSKMPELVGGDWERGHQVFLSQAANCSKCHQLRGEGTKIGPDLANLIHRDYDSVARDIREPSAAINPDFLNYVVELKNGQTLSGTIHKDGAESITLADNTGKLTEIARAQIEEMTPSRVSVMPQDITKALNPGQFRDLMIFLLTEPPAN